MAEYHFHARIISHGSGGSAVDSAAYRSGEKLRDDLTGVLFNHPQKSNPKKTDVVYTELLGPSEASSLIINRGILWNAVEIFESRNNKRSKDAQVAREYEIAIPRELSREQQITLVSAWAKDQLVDRGMIVDIAIHDRDGSNPHAHIGATLRRVEPNGQFASKKEREWNTRKTLESLRESWSLYANVALHQAGFDNEISHLSYAAQGYKMPPTIHLGPKSHALESRGHVTIRGEINRKIKELRKKTRKDRIEPEREER